jgi:hypothetical protein
MISLLCFDFHKPIRNNRKTLPQKSDISKEVISQKRSFWWDNLPSSPLALAVTPEK